MVSSTIKPILRKPRSQWRIPLLNSAGKRQPPSKLNALISGTTPLGREILRKLLFGLERRLEAKEEPLPRLVESVEAQLNTFWALQPEFALLLSRLWGGDHQAWLATTPRQLATLLVLGTNCTVQLQRTHVESSNAKNTFTIPGLGKLVLVNRKARMGRNPATGETIKIAAKRVVKFRVAKAAKDAILG